MDRHRNLTMFFSSTPLSFENTDTGIMIVRNIDDNVLALNNLIELIVFTPKGSFSGDPDFGFEYWNHEYSNVNFRNFNNEQTGLSAVGLCCEISKKECEESIRQSLSTYAPQLKQVLVSMKLLSPEPDNQRKKKNPSKYKVEIIVKGSIDDGLGTDHQYENNVQFFMEPTAKKYRI